MKLSPLFIAWMVRPRWTSASISGFNAAQPVFWWLVGGKIIYLTTLVAAVWIWDGLDTKMFHRVLMRWPREGEPVFASHFATWDAAHYLFLSEVEYQSGRPSCAFYPLWPMLVRVCAPTLGGSHVLTGIVLANAFSLMAWVLFHRQVAWRWGASAATWALISLIAFPGGLFFQFNYTESLFFLLVMVLWWGIEQRRHGWAWLGALLLPMTRGVGVFVVLPMAWYALSPAMDWLVSRILDGRGRKPGKDEQSTAPPTLSSEPFPWRATLDRAWLLVAPLVGWGIYLLLMAVWTGNPFEGFEAQKHWGVHSISNLWDVPEFVNSLFSPTVWHGFVGSVLDRCVFILLLWSLPLLWHLDKSLLVWIYVLGVIPAMSGTFTSYTRFASCAFPLFVVFGVCLGSRDARWIRWGMLTVFAALHIVLLWRFINFRWAG